MIVDHPLINQSILTRLVYNNQVSKSKLIPHRLVSMTCSVQKGNTHQINVIKQASSAHIRKKTDTLEIARCNFLIIMMRPLYFDYSRIFKKHKLKKPPGATNTERQACCFRESCPNSCKFYHDSPPISRRFYYVQDQNQKAWKDVLVQF
nr:MAG TPA: hypothetical protein [Caudoviricetes sp.]